MSPKIQERSHKSRSRINNLYLLTRPIMSLSLVANSDGRLHTLATFYLLYFSICLNCLIDLTWKVDFVTVCIVNVTCGGNHFACADRTLCINKLMHCNLHNDCRDGSDEIGCGMAVCFAPRIENVLHFYLSRSYSL